MLVCDLRIISPVELTQKVFVCFFCVFPYSTEPAILNFSTVMHIVLLHSSVVAGIFYKILFSPANILDKH
jgi:hypothetical protein